MSNMALQAQTVTGCPVQNNAGTIPKTWPAEWCCMPHAGYASLNLGLS
jgi:hypothetical protein